MKYAIPVSGGTISPHFRHYEQFALFDVEEQKKEIIAKLIESVSQSAKSLSGKG